MYVLKKFSFYNVPLFILKIDFFRILLTGLGTIRLSLFFNLKDSIIAIRFTACCSRLLICSVFTLSCSWGSLIFVMCADTSPLSASICCAWLLIVSACSSFFHLLQYDFLSNIYTLLQRFPI